MSFNSPKALIRYLSSRLSEHGARADFCRKSGISRAALEFWLASDRIPRLDQLDRIAAALGVQPWELLKPEEALPTPPKPTPTVEGLTDVIKSQEKEIEALKRELRAIEAIPTDVLENLMKVKEWPAVRAVLEIATKTAVKK